MGSDGQNIHLNFRVIQIQFERYNGFDVLLLWHLIIQGWGGVTQEACSLSLIRSYLINSDSLQSQPRVPCFLIFIDLI